MISNFTKKLVRRTNNYLGMKKWSKFIEFSQYWSKEEIEKYQLNKLKILVSHAYENVPYYKEIFESIDFHPNDLKDFKAYKQLPFLTKDILRERSEDFFPKNIEKQTAFYFTTGGSTGEPLGFYRQQINDIIERSFMYSQWGRVGFNTKSRIVILRGEPINGELIFEKRSRNSWLFSSYQLSKKNICKYADELNRIRPDFFHVYPSSFFLLTQLLLENGLQLEFSPKAILCGSEPLHQYQRELFETTFNTRTFSWLGLAEQTTLAAECEYSKNFHIWPQHSFVEMVDDEGNDVTDIGNSGQLIGTNLHNFVTPFIRYKSGDLAILDANECTECKRNFVLLSKIEGRIQDVVYLKDGSMFPISPAIYGIHDHFWSKINKIQVFQDVLGHVEIRVGTSDGGVMEKLNKALSDRFTDKLSFELKRTNNFERTSSGKHKFLIQKLKRK